MCHADGLEDGQRKSTPAREGSAASLFYLSFDTFHPAEAKTKQTHKTKASLDVTEQKFLSLFLFALEVLDSGGIGRN